MIKFICDACKKEFDYEKIEFFPLWVGFKRYQICHSCSAKYNKELVKAKKGAAKKFWKNKGLEVPETGEDYYED